MNKTLFIIEMPQAMTGTQIKALKTRTEEQLGQGFIVVVIAGGASAKVFPAFSANA